VSPRCAHCGARSLVRSFGEAFCLMCARPVEREEARRHERWQEDYYGSDWELVSPAVKQGALLEVVT